MDDTVAKLLRKVTNQFYYDCKVDNAMRERQLNFIT
jgi:hypothetical protein